MLCCVLCCMSVSVCVHAYDLVVLRDPGDLRGHRPRLEEGSRAQPSSRYQNLVSVFCRSSQSSPVWSSLVQSSLVQSSPV